MTATRIGRIGSSGPAYELAEWPTAPTHHPPVAVAINAEPARVLSSFSSLDARIAAHLREGDDLVPSAPWWNRLTVPLATDAALSTARAVAPTSETDGPVAVVTGETTAVTGWLADGGPDPADGGAHGAAVAVATAAAFPELRPLRSLQFQPTAASLPRNRGSLDLRDDTRHPAIFLSTSTTDDAAVATEMPSPTTGDDEYDEVLVALRREVQVGTQPPRHPRARARLRRAPRRRSIIVRTHAPRTASSFRAAARSAR